MVGETWDKATFCLDDDEDEDEENEGSTAKVAKGEGKGIGRGGDLRMWMIMELIERNKAWANRISSKLFLKLNFS